MKIRILLYLLLLPVCVFASDPTQMLHRYLKAKDYFRLRSEFNRVQHALNLHDRLYFQAFIHNGFNQCEASSKAIDQLMADHTAKLPDTLLVKLLQLQIDNEVKTYRYAKAAETGDRLISSYGKELDTALLADVKNSNILWKALAAVAPQEITQRLNCTITWKRDTAGLINIPVRVRNVVNDFVFDTGANLSLITTSYANQLHLQLIETSFDLGSATSIQSKAKLAVAPSIFIGNIEVKNVVFMVLPDEKLAFPQIQYQINAIIGYPVISELGEVKINQDKTLTIPSIRGKNSLQNLAMDGLLPVLAIQTEKDTLLYSFDTGAKQSMLYKSYFNKYHQAVIAAGKPDSVKMGGAGGMVKYPSYRMPSITLYPAGKPVKLPNIDVVTDPMNDDGSDYDGTIGQDLIGKFKEMIINFKEMYIDFN